MEIIKKVKLKRGHYYNFLDFQDCIGWIEVVSRGKMRKLALALSLLLLWGINCTKPTGPVSFRGPIVYAVTDQYPDNNSRVFYIDTATDSVVDSLLIPYQCYSMGVSSDGSTLYIGVSGLPFNGMEIDTKTKAIKYFGPNTGVPIPNERLLVNPWTSDFFDAFTHELVYKADSLTTPLTGFLNIGRRFDTKRKLLYGPLPNTPHKIGVFDYRRFRLVKVIDVVALGARKLPTGNAVVTFDGDKYYYSVPLFAPYEYFVGIDLRNNRLVAEHIVIGGGLLDITPLNNNIYMTDPGGYLIPPSPTGLVQIYSPIWERFLTPIDITKEPNPCDSIVLLRSTDRIAISPDGRKAYLSMWGEGSIMVIDIPSNSVKKVLCHFGFINSLAVEKN